MEKLNNDLFKDSTIQTATTIEAAGLPTWKMSLCNGKPCYIESNDHVIATF
jgi:hypothetical protein